MEDIIEIKYILWKNDEGIFRIFGDKFVENNKKQCKMIINEEEMELSSFYKYDYKEEEKLVFNEYFNEELLNKKEENKFKLEVKLKGIKNIVDISHMFDSCKEIIDLKISKFDTSNIIKMNSLFNSCIKLKNINGISKWNVNNVNNMNG